MPRDFPRARRIEDQILRILSDVLRHETRDPRLGKAVLTAVRVSRDLSVAWVYYSILMAEGEAEPLDDAFNSAQGFLRSRLAKDLTVRRVPELRFELDTTGSQARAMDQLIADVTKDLPPQDESDATEDPNKQS
jgi:ribosome-binding factor A